VEVAIPVTRQGSHWPLRITASPRLRGVQFSTRGQSLVRRARSMAPLVVLLRIASSGMLNRGPPIIHPTYLGRLFYNPGCLGSVPYWPALLRLYHLLQRLQAANTRYLTQLLLQLTLYPPSKYLTSLQYFWAVGNKPEETRRPARLEIAGCCRYQGVLLSRCT
jgi:hypothetical protein